MTLKRARQIYDYMYPLTKAIYSHLRMNWHTRIKEALVTTGEIKSATDRSFLPLISDKERGDILNALTACGLTK